MARERKLSAVEAARKLGVGLDYVYGLLWTGKLQGQEVGKRWLIPSASVEDRLRAREKTQAQPEQAP